MNLVIGRWLLTADGDQTEKQYLDFLPNGKLTLHKLGGEIQGSNHEWFISGNNVTFKFNNSYAVYRGKIENGSIIGYAKNIKNNEWNFVAQRVFDNIPKLPQFHFSRFQPLVGKWLITSDAVLDARILEVDSSGKFTLTYQKNGKLSGSNHKLNVVDNKMTLSVNNNYCVYTGEITSNQITGCAKNIVGKKFDFKAERILNDSTIKTQSSISFDRTKQGLLDLKLEWLDIDIAFLVNEVKVHNGRAFQYHALNFYYPLSKFPELPTTPNMSRQFVFDFKNGVGSSYDKAAISLASAIVNLLKYRFDASIVCCIIPASSAIKTENRFKKFLKRISELLGFIDGYEVLVPQQDVEAVHLSGRTRGDISNLKINRTLIENKMVFIFDDVMTTGRSFGAIAEALVKNGAKDVVGFYLAKTYDSFTLGEPKW